MNSAGILTGFFCAFTDRCDHNHRIGSMQFISNHYFWYQTIEIEMKKGSVLLIVLLGLLLIRGCMTCNVQKSLVTLAEGVKAKWGEVQNQYQRRSDLVPNLVATVKG